MLAAPAEQAAWLFDRLMERVTPLFREEAPPSLCLRSSSPSQRIGGTLIHDGLQSSRIFEHQMYHELDEAERELINAAAGHALMGKNSGGDVRQA